MSDEVTPPAPPAAAPVPNTSGQGAASQVPEGVARWSWGGFLMTWMWGIGNSTWLALLALLPGAGLVMAIILGIKGNEWAWRNKQWASVEEFHRVQRIWAWVGLGLIIVAIVGAILIMTLVFGVLVATEGGLESAFDDFEIEFNEEFDTDSGF